MFLFLHLRVVSGIICVVWGDWLLELVFDIPVVAQETAGFSTCLVVSGWQSAASDDARSESRSRVRKLTCPTYAILRIWL